MKQFCVAALMLLSCLTTWSQASTKVYGVVLINASIVDVKGDSILPNKLLAIDSGVIRVIDNTSKESEYQARNRVDLQNQFVIPGLWDMHVHFVEDSLIEENKALLPLFLAYGITTVRDCGSNIIPSLFKWRKEIAAGRLAGPRIFISGPRIDGHKIPWKGFLKVETSSEIEKALDSLQQLKVDFVKLYQAAISREAYLHTLSMAEVRGLKTSGHLPSTVKATEASKAGLDALEHITSVLIGCSSKEDSITGLANLAYQKSRIMPDQSPLFELADKTYDSTVASNFFHELALNHTAVVPTLIIHKMYSEISTTDHSQDSLLAYIPSKIRAAYQLPVNYSKKQPQKTRDPYKNLMFTFLKLTRELEASGVTLLAGTDYSPFSPYLYPGFSLHEELKLFVKAGLTPAEALQTATINGAKFMNVDKVYGSIDVGKQSDMVVLATNPLLDINALDHIRMVMANGKLYTREDLDRLMREIRQK